MSVFITVKEPPAFLIAAPLLPELLSNTESITTRLDTLYIAPEPVVPWFSVKVEPIMVNFPLFSAIAPPLVAAVLFLNVESIIY